MLQLSSHIPGLFTPSPLLAPASYPRIHNVTNGNRRTHGTADLGLAAGEVNTQCMAGVALGAELWAVQAATETIVDHSLG